VLLIALLLLMLLLMLMLLLVLSEDAVLDSDKTPDLACKSGNICLTGLLQDLFIVSICLCAALLHGVSRR
jgi:hypothetical protein